MDSIWNQIEKLSITSELQDRIKILLICEKPISFDYVRMIQKSLNF